MVKRLTEHNSPGQLGCLVARYKEIEKEMVLFNIMNHPR